MADAASPVPVKSRKPRSQTPDKHSLTISFTEADDMDLYDRIISGAKHDRRQPGQFALLKLHEVMTSTETAD